MPRRYRRDLVRILKVGAPLTLILVALSARWNVTAPAVAEALSPQANNVPIPIGQVQGIVDNKDRGTAHRSAFAPRTPNNAPRNSVVVQGVIYSKLLSFDDGQAQHGFLIQNTRETADADPNTADGIFVFVGFKSDFRDGYSPVVGDEVIVRGEVTEYFGQTQLSRPQLVRAVRQNVDLDKELPPIEAQPPNELEDANRYWERREGMRVRVRAGSIAVSGRHHFKNDSEIWFAGPDTTIARRTQPYARRVFRDTHPLDNVPEVGFDDGNGYRITLGSQALRGADGAAAVIAAARTFDSLAKDVVGGVAYSFGKYIVQVERQIEVTRGADPSLNAPPQRPDQSREYSIATYNVENLYDYRDDPNDACDFVGNAGCQGVTPPFDYVPANEKEYQTRLQKLARNVIDDLHTPDILLLVEVEDQDTCTIADGAMKCGAANNADGKPDTAQDLALAIRGINGTEYEAAFDRDGADARGITCAFLYRKDRVQMPVAAANDPLLGATAKVIGFDAGLIYNSDVQNPKALNAPLGAMEDRDTEGEHKGVFTRAPQIGFFRVWQQRVGTGQSAELYAIVNHFSSRPDSRVAQRRQQANYLAALTATLQKSDARVRVLAGGDLNVYPRPDDPFPPAQRKTPSDQLAALYDGGLLNLWDVLAAQVPESAYTYVYNGQAQTLDHLFNTPSLNAALQEVRVAHINADWPSESNEVAKLPARGVSDHDPVVARYRFGASR